MNGNTEAKVVQLIPADDWMAVYKSEVEGDDALYWSPLVAWGLLDNGEVVGMEADECWVVRCDGTTNFKGYQHRFRLPWSPVK